MAIRQLQSLVSGLHKDRVKSRKQKQRLNNRRVLSERLEDRRMLAGPELIAIRPDAGALLRDGDTLTTAPSEFNLLFKGGADLLESRINANTVRLVRSGGDGLFDGVGDVAVALGYVGLVNPGDTDPSNLQQVVLRPASSASHNATDPFNQFPDDTYQIQIIGSGASPLSNRSLEAFQNGVDLVTTFRLDRGAQVVSIVPQPVSRNTQRINVAGSVTGGTYTLTFQGQTTAPLAFNASNAAIQNALVDLSNVQPDDVIVSGSREVTFQGQFAGEQVGVMTVSSSALIGGTASVTRLNTLTQASDQIVVYFDTQRLNEAEVLDPKFYRLVNTSASLTSDDDQTLLPRRVTYDPVENSAVLTFANAIPEGNYRLDIGESGGADSTLSSALKVGALFNSNRFVKNGFLGDEGGVSNNGLDVDLYEIQLRAGATLTAALTPHAATLNARLRLLDSSGAPLASASAGPGALSALNVPGVAAGTYYLEVSSVDGSVGSYLLDAGTALSPLTVNDNNSTIGTATNVGLLGAAGLLVSSQIQPQGIPLPPLPGSEDEPGHRQIQREQHIGANGTTPSVPQPTRVVRYYFPDTLGTDSNGVAYLNLITATERQIVREIFEIYAQQSGYEFIESPATFPGGADLMIGKGDFRAVDPTLGPNAGVAGLANSSFALANGSIYNQANRFYGDGFTLVMFHEIGHSLGLGHSYDLPSVQGAPGSLQSDVFPGDHDLVHLQRIRPANSTDIDMYRFDIAEAGRLSAETIAERLATPSLLNSVLTLYKQLPGGDIEVIARNDQYIGADAFLQVDLAPGTYFIGVTSTGNTQYDPRVPDSGFGGSTNGAYNLKLSFEADRGGSLRDVSGTSMDGDADGTAGGVHSFWFQSNDVTASIYVDKLADTTAGVVNGTGTLADPYDTISFALQRAGNRIVVPTDGATSITTGQQFVVDDGVNSVTFRFGTTGVDRVDITAATNATDVATAIVNAVNAAKTAGRLSPSVSVTATGGGRVVQFAQIDNLDISQAPTLVNTPNIVRIVGNGGPDQNITTLADDRPYLIGQDTSGNPLADGGEFLVPQGVTVMIHAGALFKLRKANLDVGSSSANISRSSGAIQVLGTPKNSVFLRSYHDDTVGGNSDGVGPAAGSGDFGGIVFRDDSDLESSGIFLNYVNHVDINHGGGKVFVDANEAVYTPIHIVDARPTISFNRISNSDDAAISASPDSFDDSLNRIGPDVNGNYLTGNTTNGLFIRIDTPLGASVDKLTVAGRFDDTDIAHVLTENLIIAGAAGGPVLTSGGTLVARAAGRLVVDPGIVLKMNKARIEAERGAGSLIAEGTVDRPVIFTSTKDDRYGGSGSYDTDRSSTLPAAGNWGGLFFGEATSGSLDHVIVTFGGGLAPIEGGDANFNAVEIHQADVRISNSLIQSNASGAASGQRNGRGVNSAAAIYVRGAQPVIVDNEIADNAGPAININANSLRFDALRDPGRSTGNTDIYDQFADNHGPFIRLNRLENNAINGMLVRGEELTTESIWDDTDIVHVLQSTITVDNLHSYGGLTLQSSNSESLVVKLAGANAGFTATGTPVEIIDRVGGSIHVLGTVGHPVILTHIADDSVGAGFTPDGKVNSNTNNTANRSVGVSGGWRGFVFDEFSNDRNVAVVRELENPLTNNNDVNATPGVSQLVGTLAPNQKSGDENRRLGFEIHGYISPNDPNDVDVYSFKGTAGTPVWIDVDRTDSALDAIIEVVNATGTVLARSMRSGNLSATGTLNAATLTQNALLGGDTYTQNFRDPGFYYVLPATGTHFVRIRSNPASAGSVTTIAGESRGQYQLQVRLQQIDEFPGSTVQFADIRFAQTGIDVRGLPAHSPLVGEAGELAGQGADFANAQTLVNLLQTDVAALGISGALSDANDVDWYSFELRQTGVQVIGGVNDNPGTTAVVFDIDYADGAVRGDTTAAVYDANQNLIYIGRESNVTDDQRLNPTGSIDDLSRGSLGIKDSYIGPIHLIPGGTYYVAVMSDRQLPSALSGAYVANPANEPNTLARLEPVTSVRRVVEDHIGFSGYNSHGAPVTSSSIFDISSLTSLNTHIPLPTLENVNLYVATDRSNANADDQLYIADPFNGGRYKNPISPNSWSPVNDDIQDIVIRSDGRMFGYQRAANVNNSVGRLVEIDPTTGALTTVRLDGIPGETATPNVRNLNANLTTVGNRSTVRDERADQFTVSDDVDALTFERTGAATNAPTYDVYYVVRESDTSSKLYRGKQDGDASPVAAFGGNPNAPGSVAYGLMGNIQSGATAFIDLTDGVNFASLQLSSLTGNTFTVRLTRNPMAVTPIELTAVNVASRTATINIDSGTAVSAANLLAFINNDTQLSQFIRATLASGNAATVGSATSPAPTTTGAISDAGTNYALVTFFDGTTTSRARLTSLSGAFNLTLTRDASASAVTAFDVPTQTVTVNLDSATAPTLGQFINLINSHPQVSTFLQASIATGNAGSLGSVTSPAPASVTDATTAYTNIPFDDGTTLSNVRLSSQATQPFQLTITRNIGPNAVTAVNTVNRTVSINLDRRTAPSVGTFVNLINLDPQVSQFLLASITAGTAANVGSVISPAATGPLTGTTANYAMSTFSVSDNSTPVNRTQIRVQSTTPGATGNFTLNISRPGSNTTASIQSVNLTTRTINLNIGNQNNGGPSAAAIVDAINNHVDASQLVTAVIVGGNANANGDGNDGTVANNVSNQTLVAGIGTSLAGRVTGIAFNDPVSPTALFGVTNAGEFISINKNTGAAVVLGTAPGASFQGLALGPQNVEGGIYKDLFFAVTASNDLYAFDASGVLQGVFAGGATTVGMSDISPANGDTPVGIAFTPLDINLWHPTTRRANDAGHGINVAPDGTRTPGDVDVAYADEVGGTRTFNQRQGGASFYFGLESHIAANNFNSGTQGYLTYPGGENAQYGLTEKLHRDLASNPNIANTYNLPGGASGTLLSSSFSLAGSVPADRPTMYLNYYLETENHPGETNANGQDPFRDSARIFATRDNGVTWELLATNNSALSSADPTAAVQAELPGFLSHLSDAGLNSGTPRLASRQIVQELFDQVAPVLPGDPPQRWRQLRVDLSTFANEPNVQFRFDFATAGRVFGDPTSAAFGELNANNRSNGSINNAFEGFYIDDIIVGYAERGEMVTGTNADSGITNLFAGGARTRDNDPNQNPDIVSGAYQLEVRRTDEYINARGEDPFVAITFNTNDRHVNDVSQTASVTFEPATAVPSRIPVDTTLGGVTIPAAAIAPWAITTTNPFTGSRSLESGNVTTPLQPVSIFQATTAALGSATTGAGVLQFSYSVSSAAEKHGLRFFIDGVPQNLISPDPENPGSDTTLASGELEYRTVEFSFGAGLHNFAWVYDFRDGAAAEGLNKAFIDNILLLQGGTGLVADRNRERAQGMFIVDSNFITDSSVRGINVEPGTTQAGGSVPHPGSTINFPQLNTQRLVPGIVIQNNVVAGSSGIRFAGETTPDPQRPVPFGRILNNTLVGDDRSGIGIEVVGLASPTLLNNLLTDLATGIVNGGTGTVIRSNFFQDNASNGTTGTSATIVTPATTPLFVDAANRNYYLVPNSAALDSSQSVEQDRFNYVTFKTELGIPESPIFAPERDVYGQLRVDSSASPGGGGASVFIDRGAVDSSDKDNPYAVLLNPVDNDAAGQDRDPNDTVVYLTDPLLENFSILLGDGRGPSSPFEGTGINGLTVSDPVDVSVAARAVTIVHNGRTLVQDVDYTLGYNSQTGVLLLTPLSTLWEQTGVYTITLDNTQIADLAGNRLRSNQTDGTTKFFVLMPDVRFDFGDAPDSFSTLLASNSARHTIQPGATPRLGRRIDSESDALVAPGSDDQRQTVALSTTSPVLFDVSGSTANGGIIAVSATAVPVGGEQVTVQIGPNTATFELVAAGFAPQRGNVAVPLLATDTAETIATRLAAAINASLVQEGDGAVVAVDATLPNTITVETFDDEDGVAVGRYDNGTENHIVFLKPGAPEFTTDPADVLGFLNPLDELGTTISINASSAGLLDAWIDFNGDGAFGIDEQIFTNQPLSVGDNTLQIVTPLNTADGERWARFRISEFGNLGPDELAIGGEVEDYLVEIINVPPTVPADDTFTVDEDAVLDTTNAASFPGTLFTNDPVTGFLPPRFIVDSQPTNGTLTVTDPLSGRFVYTPAADYYGQDTFTYWVSTQPVPGTVLPPNVELATVTITVVPVNDAPLAVDRQFPALEDTSVTITAAALLAGAVGHESPDYVSSTGETYPWDESNQDATLKIVSINIDGTDYNATSGPVVSSRGSFALTFAAGALVDLVFTPAQDLNRDNLRDPAVDPAILQSFTFTVEDDGISRDPVTDADIAGTPEQHTATATINVAPRNDTPTTNTDFVTVGPIGSTTAATDWRQYFVGLGLPVPQPTEDVTLTIPAAFLLQNDLAGSVTALDENNFISGNDAPLTITSVSISNRDAAVSIDPSGNIVFVPPTDVYGDVIFTYVVTDSGVDETLGGTRTVVPRTQVGTVTVTVQPVNDTPVTFNRAFSFNESAAPGVDAPAHVFTAAQLLTGSGSEQASIPGLFATDLPAPFNESEQLATLRVAAFTTAAGTVDGASLASSGGTGTLTLASDDGGRFEYDFVNFAFTTGRFFPRADYNLRTPFAATERFQFVVEDSGATTDPQNLANVISLPHERSAPATATITVANTNDAPIFNIALNPVGQPAFDILERDDLGSTVISSAIVNIFPGPLTALDELQRQGVTFSVVSGLSTVPAGLMAAAPTIADDGTLTIFPAVDAVGTAVYVFDAIDNEPGTTGFVPRTTRSTLTVNVRPVNDQPRLSAVAGTSLTTNADEAWTVDGADGTIRFTMKEDNTGAGGTTSPYIIDTRQSASAANRVGLLDPFTVGPTNESNSTLGGSQTLRVASFSAVTALGGSITVTATDAAGNPTRFAYTPPTDYNLLQGTVDSFDYVIADNAPLGETWDLSVRGLVEDNLTRAGRVEFLLNPVNDAPSFTIPVTTNSVLEDAGAVVVAGFATSISVGPPATAVDEPLTQTPTFNLTAVGSVAGLFAVPPAISSSGTLTFTPAADAVGTAVYDVFLNDLGPASNPRGDLNQSGPVRITINIRPVNDTPRLVSPTGITDPSPTADDAWSVDSAGTIRYTLKEDNTGAGGVTSPYTFSAILDLANVRVGLLDPYVVGPANEGDSTLGGSQTLRVTSFPVGTDSLTTTLGGTVTVTARDANGFATHFAYVPPVDYNSLQGDVDSFDYTLEDNATGLGETWNLASDGLVEDRLSRTGKVEFLLNPVNDQPLFSIPVTTYSALEDAGTVTVPGFAIDIAPGPATAGDELTDQTLTFDLQPLTPENGLFLVSPTIGSDGALTFTSAPDAVGSVSYVVNLLDDGADDNPRGDINSLGPVTITIHVRPVNDQPRLNTAVTGTSQTTNADEAWSVNNTGLITYTLPEDNTGSGGTTSPYLIDARRIDSAADRIGLLDVFTVGPANEADGTLGGSQSLRILNVQSTTALGGTLTVVARDANNFATQIAYVPPANYNALQGVRDSFTYVVEDDAPSLGESWSLSNNGLVENRTTRTGRAEFVLNPVNDRPLFTIASTTHSVLEDSGNTVVPGFATGIAVAPASAADELISQTASFTLTAQTPENGLFAVSPTIAANGTLSFTPAADAVGSVVYVVALTDTGAADDARGDLNSQGPVTITINVRPVNDAPRLNATVVNTNLTSGPNEAWAVDSAGEITYTLAEDNTQSPGVDAPYVIDVRRVGSRIGLLDPFIVGPSNESDATLGGSQSLRITDLPATTDLGGTLTVLATDSDGFVTRFSYTPPANYNSLQGPNDSFSYTFEDDADATGETYDLTTDSLVDDRLSRTGRVRFVLNPLNDAPDFAGAANVAVNEDSTAGATVGQTVIPNFVTNIVAGPEGADDELVGASRQTVTFTVVPLSGNTPGLFSAAPSVDAAGTLSFTTAPDANGVARFTIVADDSGIGSSTDPLQTDVSAPRTFTITVTGVNDAPSFTAGADVTVAEDSGAYTSGTPYATDIIPGPANEVADGQTVSFTVSVPSSSTSLFAVQPSISPTGFLTFTPADDAVGTVVLNVVAVDSLGAPSLPASLTITITEVNDPPIANDFSVAVDEDNTVVVTQSEFLVLATDPDLESNPNEVLTITDLLAVSPAGAAVTVNSSGDVIYDPRASATLQALRPGQTMTDTFTYRLQDAAGVTSDLATVTITVSGRNDKPVAVDDFAVLLSGVSSVLQPLTNDSDIDGTLDPSSLIITDQPTNGSLSVRPDGTLVYTPRVGFRGQDTIGYTIGDNLGQQSSQATITVDVAPLPVIADIVTGTYVGEPVTIDLSGADVPAGTLDFSSVVIVREPTNGTVTVLTDGSLSYQPDDDFVGSDDFDFTISDQQGRTSAPVKVTVRTVDSRLQNPELFTDVNASGTTTPLDALLIINHIARSIRRGEGNTIPVLDTDRGPNFYDASGDGLITTGDALRVINQISRDNRNRPSGGEGEASGLLVGMLAAPEIENSPIMISTGTTVEPSAPPIVTSIDHGSIAAEALFQADEEIELIAWDASDEDEDRMAEKLDAFDAAWSDFSEL